MSENTTDASTVNSNLSRCQYRRNTIKFVLWTSIVIFTTEYWIIPLVYSSLTMFFYALSNLFLFFNIGVLSMIQYVGTFLLGRSLNLTEFEILDYGTQSINIVLANGLSLLFFPALAFIIRLQAIVYWFSARKQKWFNNDLLKAIANIFSEYFNSTKEETEVEKNLKNENISGKEPVSAKL